MKKLFLWCLWALGILLGAFIIITIADWLAKHSEKVF